MDSDKNPRIPEPGNDMQNNGQPLVRNGSIETPSAAPMHDTPTTIAPADIESPTVFDHSGETTLDHVEQSSEAQSYAPVPTPAQGDPMRSPEVAPVTVTPTPAPGTQPDSAMFAPTPPAPTKKPVKKGLLAIILAGALVVLGGGTTLAYNLWYQNPDKVVTDGLINVIRAKSVAATGTLTASSKEFNLSIAMDAKGAETASAGSADVTLTLKGDFLKGEKFSVKGSYVVAPEGDLYVRVDKLAAVVDAYVDSMIDMQTEMYSSFGVAMTESEIAEIRKEATAAITPTVEKIDSQWIKISAEDVKEQTEGDAEAACYQDVVTKLQTEKSMSKELYVKYTENRFVTVKEELGSKDGSLGYVLGFDKDAAKSFGEAVKETEVYKQLAKCGTEEKADDIIDQVDELEAETDKGNIRVELWIDRLSHKITSLSATGDDGKEGDGKTTASLNLTTDFDSKVTVDIPENAKSFKELEKDIQGLTGAAGI